MKTLIHVATAIIIATSPVAGRIAKQKDAIEQEIRKHDLAHADAVLRGDLAALDKLWTRDFKVNNPFNEIDKADRIALALSHILHSFGRLGLYRFTGTLSS